MKILIFITVFLSIFTLSQLATAANHNTTRSNHTSGTAAPFDESKGKIETKKTKEGRNPQTGKVIAIEK